MEKEKNIEERIIDKALVLFSEKGYTRTSMSDIASAVGITRPTLHYYFRTKEKLFDTVFGLLIEAFLPKIELIANSESAFWEKVEKIIDEYIRIYLQNPFLPQFILGEIQRDSKHLISFAKKIGLDNYLLVLKKNLDEEIREGRIKPIPLPNLLLTFFGQLISPFLLKNLLVDAFLENDSNFERFLEDWKLMVLEQTRSLLIINN